MSLAIPQEVSQKANLSFEGRFASSAFQLTGPQALGTASGDKVKTETIPKWIMSSDTHTTYAEDGAVLVDFKKGLCYRLNVVAARIWITIESSPDGITVGGIVDALETHFDVGRQQLEEDTSHWLDKLQRFGLVHQRIGQIVDSS